MRNKKDLLNGFENGTKLTKMDLNRERFPEEHRQFLHQMYNLPTAQDVMDLLTHANTPLNSTLCMFAVRRCKMLNDMNTAMHVYRWMAERNIARTTEIYAVLIHGLGHSDRLGEAYQLFRDMQTTQDRLRPTIQTYTALLSGCKVRSQTELAEQIWTEIKHDDNIAMDVILYTVMISIHGKSGQVNKAEMLWNEFKNEASNDADEGICGAMIECFVHSCELHKAMDILQYMQEQHIHVQTHHYSMLIGGFLRLEQPNRAWMMFKQIQFNNLKLNQSCFRQLCQIKCMLLKHELMHGVNMQLAQKHYQELDKLPFKYKQFVEHETDKMEYGKIKFEALLAMQDREMIDSASLIGEFRAFMKNRCLPGYWTQNDNEWCIDLHFHSESTARFILRYVFQYEPHFVTETTQIICGKSSHSAKMTTEKTMKQVVREELLSWTPPIRITTNTHNRGKLQMIAEDAAHYIQNKKTTKTRTKQHM